MQKVNRNQDKQKQAGLSADWQGLGNEPRNENLARIRALGSFERQEIARERDSRDNERPIWKS